MTGVFSFWDTNKKDNCVAGCNSQREFLYIISLAVNTARKHFKKLNLVTNDYGKKLLIDNLKLPFDNINLVFNEKTKDLNKIFWGFTKIIAYKEQTEPFVHIDNDVFLWNGIKEDCKTKDIFFQSVEPFEAQPQWYGYYKQLLAKSGEAPFFPEIIRKNYTRIAYNCGVVGCNNLDLITEWHDVSKSYVSSELNKDFFNNSNNLLIHQNLLSEQYFISSILERRKLTLINGKVGVLAHDLNNLCGDYKYTHLWGLSKRDKSIVNRVINRVKNDYSNTSELIEKYIKKS